MGFSQAEVAARARVSRAWISEFEAGKPTAELGLVLRLFDALELELVVQARGDAEPAPREGGDDGVDLDSLLDDYRSS